MLEVSNFSGSFDYVVTSKQCKPKDDILSCGTIKCKNLGKVGAREKQAQEGFWPLGAM